MNIIEALKSGKNYRRHGWEGTILKPEVGYTMFIFSSPKFYGPRMLKTEDVLAEDWEVVEEVYEEKPTYDGEKT